MADGHVRHGATAIHVVISAVTSARLGVRDALNLGFSWGGVELGVAQQDDPAPLPPHIVWRRAVKRVVLECEYNGSLRSAIGLNLTTSCHDQRRGICTGPTSAFDHSSWFDGQYVAVIDKDKTIQHIGVVAGPRGCACAAAIVGDDHLGKGWGSTCQSNRKEGQLEKVFHEMKQF